TRRPRSDPSTPSRLYRSTRLSRRGPNPAAACSAHCLTKRKRALRRARSVWFAPRLGRERRAASAARLRVGVDEGEASRQPLLDVVERRAVQVEIALLVDHDLDAVELELLVVGAALAVELEGVRHPRASAPLPPHPQEHGLRQVLGPLELLHLLRRGFRQCDRHRSSFLPLPISTPWRRPPMPASPDSRPARP